MIWNWARGGRGQLQWDGDWKGTVWVKSLTFMSCDFGHVIYQLQASVQFSSVLSLSHVQLCDTVDYSQPDSSVHVIFQTRLLEWIAIPFSRAFSLPRDQTQVSCIAGRFLVIWATREAPIIKYHSLNENVSKTGMGHIKVRYYKITCTLFAFYVIHWSINWFCSVIIYWGLVVWE